SSASCKHEREPLVVLAASSLSDVLPRIGARYEAQTGQPIAFSFAGTSRLATQIEAGTRSDLFFSASSAWMEHVEGEDLTLAGSARGLLTNSLVVIAPRDAVAPPGDIAGLSDPRIARIAMASQHVPAGKYGRDALTNLGAWSSIKDRVIFGDSVRVALEWVARAEADVGVVYATDAREEARVEVLWTLPAESHDPILYPAAVLESSTQPERALDFLEFCQRAEQRALLEGAGFSIAPEGSYRKHSEEKPAPSRAATRDVALRSLWVGLLCALLGFFPATAFGFLLARRKLPGKAIISTLLLSPMVMPPVVTGYLLLWLFGRQGVLGSLLLGVGVEIPFSRAAPVLAALVIGAPLYLLVARQAFEAIDPKLESVARAQGFTPWQTFCRVSLPLAAPGLAAGAVLAFARALGEFGATIVLAGNIEGRTQTLALAVYSMLERPGGESEMAGLVGVSVAFSLGSLL
ncbi:unnamed protein product, partial [Laminaria digitata]